MVNCGKCWLARSATAISTPYARNSASFAPAQELGSPVRARRRQANPRTVPLPEKYPSMLLLFVLLLSMRLAEAQPPLPQAHEYIRVVQENGAWWFQDGSGHEFFSLGVNCVGGSYCHAEATPM